MVGLDDAVVVELEVGLDDLLVKLVGLGGGVAHVLVVLLLLLLVLVVVVDVVHGPHLPVQIQPKKSGSDKQVI